MNMSPAEVNLISKLTLLMVAYAMVHVFGPLAVEWLKNRLFEPKLGRRDYDGHGQTIFITNEAIAEWLDLYKRHIEIQERTLSIVSESKNHCDETKKMVEQNLKLSEKSSEKIGELHQRLVLGH